MNDYINQLLSELRTLDTTGAGKALLTALDAAWEDGAREGFHDGYAEGVSAEVAA